MRGPGDNIVARKSYDFAIKCVNLYKFLCSGKHEFVLSKQMLRSGTSIGANIAESRNAQSTADFIHKLSIALKESDETLFWLKSLHKGDYLNEKEYESIYNDAEELVKILVSSINTLKKKQQI